MKIRYYFLSMVCLLSFLIIPRSNALLPVIDNAEILKTIELIHQLSNEIAEVKSLNQTLQNQYQFLQQNLKGNFGYGLLGNTTQDLNTRQWSNDSWVDVLNEVSTPNTSAFSQAERSYEKMYPVADPQEIGSRIKNGGLARTYYQQKSSISRAALAASSFSYNQINQHIKTIHDLLAKLENQPSEKAAIDLNTRLVAELSFIQLEMLKMQDIQMQLKATSSQGAVNGMSDEAQFMQWNP